MSSLPSAIIFINGDAISYPVQPPPPTLPDVLGIDPTLYIGLSPSGGTDPDDDVLSKLQIQLFIDDTITYQEYLSRLSVQPDYNVVIHLRQLRVLVIVPSYFCFIKEKYHDWNGYQNLECHDDRAIFIPAGLVHNDCFDGYQPWNYHREFLDGYCDVVMYYHYGMIDILENRFDRPGLYEHNTISFHEHSSIGHPKQSYDAQRINIYALLRASRPNQGECQLPFGFGGIGCCLDCKSPFYCDRCHTFSGIKIHCGCECRCWCNIYAPNCDKEANNWAFIHRK
jgi:hypothetical protein